jgi:hypothetical protein
MKPISLIPAKPQEFGGGDSNVEHGSLPDGDRKEAEGVTPLWTVFHLYNYFWRYFANFGISANFFEKRPEFFDKINWIEVKTEARVRIGLSHRFRTPAKQQNPP